MVVELGVSEWDFKYGFAFGTILKLSGGLVSLHRIVAFSAFHGWHNISPLISNVTVQRTAHFVRRTLEPIVQRFHFLSEIFMPVDRENRKNSLKIAVLGS